jgi:hypothetical protein
MGFRVGVLSAKRVWGSANSSRWGVDRSLAATIDVKMLTSRTRKTLKTRFYEKMKNVKRF